MKIKKLQKLVIKNWLLILIFLLAALIRVWDVPNRIIFFDDAAYDVRSAQQALQEREIPLLGIPSSVPRFKQGPLTVWMNMVIISLFGNNITALSFFFIFISLLSLVLVYEFCDRYLSRRISLISVVLLAFSPLAIAQARMPYHTNPIPLALVMYLFALVRLYENKQGGVFWAVVSWAILFQFELAVFPTILLIPYILYRNKQVKIDHLKKQIKPALLGLILGLLPQILYDLQNKFSQLGLFLVWIAYRIVSLFGGEHSFGGNKVEAFVDSFSKYGGRIFSTDVIWFKFIFFFLLGYALLVIIRKLLQKKGQVAKALEVVTVFTLLLALSYLMHGGPSEAYFPPFIVLLPILVGYSLHKLFTDKPILLIIFLSVYALFNVKSIFDHNFFVSNNLPFSYGYSVKEQREVIDFIVTHSEGDYQLDTTREMRKFKSTFDNLRFFSEVAGVAENKSSKKYYYVEDKESILQEMPLVKVQHFPSVDVYYYE